MLDANTVLSTRAANFAADLEQSFWKSYRCRISQNTSNFGSRTWKERTNNNADRQQRMHGHVSARVGDDKTR